MSQGNEIIGKVNVNHAQGQVLSQYKENNWLDICFSGLRYNSFPNRLIEKLICALGTNLSSKYGEIIGQLLCIHTWDKKIVTLYIYKWFFND